MIFAIDAFSQMQNFEEMDEKGEVTEKPKDPKLQYYKENYNEVFTEYYFDEVWNAILKSIEATGCQIGTKSNSQNDEGFFKGKIVSDFCVFAMKESKHDVIDSLIKYSYELPLIRAGVWESGRVQYKIILKEHEENVEMILKAELSGREGYVTNEVHWWKSNGYFEHHLIESIKANLAKGE
jgi:hypothetical protein